MKEEYWSYEENLEAKSNDCEWSSGVRALVNIYNKLDSIERYMKEIAEALEAIANKTS